MSADVDDDELEETVEVEFEEDDEDVIVSFAFLSNFFSAVEDDVLAFEVSVAWTIWLAGPSTEPLSRAVTIPALKIFDFKFIKKITSFKFNKKEWL